MRNKPTGIRKPLPTDVVERIQKLREEGHGNRAVARIVGVTHTSVRKYQTVPVNKMPPPVTAEEREEIRRLWSAGHRLPALCRQFKRSEKSIMRAVEGLPRHREKRGGAHAQR